MPRPIWKGHITFGLVHIPVVLFSGEQRADLSFKLIDSRNHARVRYERVNETTGEEVPWNEIVKGYEFDKGSYVLLSDEDFKRASVEMTQTVEIEEFVDRESIDPVYFDRPYYLVPGKKAEKPYVLFREALRRSDKLGIAKVVIRSRQHLAVVIPRGNAMVLDLLRFHQEVRPLEDFDLPGDDLRKLKVTNKEIEMAEKLIDGMTAEWEPEKYEDEYYDVLMKLIEERIEAGQLEPVAEGEAEEVEAEEPETVNLMELLKQSVEESGKGKKRKSGSSRKRAS